MQEFFIIFFFTIKERVDNKIKNIYIRRNREGKSVSVLAMEKNGKARVCH
jgi:hypothetical protein